MAVNLCLLNALLRWRDGASYLYGDVCVCPTGFFTEQNFGCSSYTASSHITHTMSLEEGKSLVKRPATHAAASTREPQVDAIFP